MTKTMFVELGMGVDLHGRDVTKASVRAVKDAIGRNYLPGMRRLLDEGAGRMVVRVTLAAPEGIGAPDADAVRAALPYGEVTVTVVPGGMLAPDGLGDEGGICVVNAAVEVGVEP